MIFSNTSCFDEVVSQLEKNIQSISKTASIRNDDRKSKIIAFLSLATELLDSANLEKEACGVAAVLNKIAEPGKTSEENFNKIAWMFIRPEDTVEIETYATAAPSAHTRSWDPKEKETPANQKPSINQVGGNIGTDRKATDNADVNAPSHKFEDDAKADDTAAPAVPEDASGNTGSGGNGPSDVRSPTSTEVRSPTSTSTEVRSPTSTSTEAYTADNFTATVTGGAGAGATTVNIYPGAVPAPSAKTNPNVPDVSKQSSNKKANIRYSR